MQEGMTETVYYTRNSRPVSLILSLISQYTAVFNSLLATILSASLPRQQIVVVPSCSISVGAR
jgi:hypothetical protein